jgi:hypothetical protein
VRVTAGTGTTEVLDPDRPQCPQCGSRHKVYVAVPCETEAVRAYNPARTVHVFAVLLTRNGKNWDADDAWAYGPALPKGLLETTPGQLLKWLQAEIPTPDPLPVPDPEREKTAA